MQLQEIDFKNIDREAEDFLSSKTNEMLATFKNRGDFRAYFEKVGEYGYTGSMHVESDWGSIDTTLKDSNIYRLYKRLKHKLKAQLAKRKHYSREIEDILPWILP